MNLNDEQLQDMMMQTQSSEYKEWMDEEEWDEAKVQEKPGMPYGSNEMTKGTKA